MATLMFLFIFVSISAAQHSTIQGVPDEVSPLHLELRDETIYVSWSLLNPSGNVSGYKVVWYDGAHDTDKLTTQTEFVLDYPFDVECFTNLSVIVAPYDDNFNSVGVKSIQSFTKQDMILVTLSQRNNEIRASFQVNCKGRQFFLLCFNWKNNGTNMKPPCQIPISGGSADNVGKCSSISLQLCTRQAVTVNLKEFAHTVGVPTTGMFPAYDLEFENLGSQSLTLTWQRSHHLCNVSGYNIFYTGVKRWGRHQTDSGNVSVPIFSKNNGHDKVTNRMKHILDDLVPYTDYQMCLSAEFSQSSDTKCCISLKTLEAPPGSPTSLRVMSNETTMVTHWQLPTAVNGLIKYYTVRWYNGSEDLGVYKTTDQYHVLEYPVPCLTYTVSVTATTGAGEGPETIQRTVYGDGCQISASTTDVWTQSVTLPPTNKSVNYGLFIALPICILIICGLVLMNYAKIRNCLNNRKSRGPSSSRMQRSTSPSSDESMELPTQR